MGWINSKQIFQWMFGSHCYVTFKTGQTGHYSAFDANMAVHQGHFSQNLLGVHGTTMSHHGQYFILIFCSYTKVTARTQHLFLTAGNFVSKYLSFVSFTLLLFHTPVTSRYSHCHQVVYRNTSIVPTLVLWSFIERVCRQQTEKCFNKDTFKQRRTFDFKPISTWRALKDHYDKEKCQ